MINNFREFNETVTRLQIRNDETTTLFFFTEPEHIGFIFTIQKEHTVIQ